MLKPILIANATSCAIFGLIFTFYGAQSSAFLGSPPVLLMTILGVGLVSNSILLMAAALNRATPRAAIMTFAFGDAAWLVLTLILVIFGVWITTTAGIIAALAVAVFVGLCGWFQWQYMPPEQAAL